MAKKPIKKFKTEEQFEEVAKWWQHRLNLDSWFIKFVICETPIPKEEDDDEDIEYLGKTCFNFINKQATIEIDNLHGCVELSLVHELCHLLIPFIELSDMYNVQYEENAFRSNVIHQALEELAKDLLLVKYPSIDRDFFMFELDEEGF